MSFLERFMGKGNPEASTSPESEAATIESASTFDEFYAAIRSHGELVNSSGKPRDKEEVIRVIDEIRKFVTGEGLDGKVEGTYGTGYNLDNVTRAAGIREKVAELLAEK